MSPDPQSERARVAVTGASGFIGSHLVRALAADGATDIVAVSRSHTEVPAAASAATSLADALKQPTRVVYHLAGLAHEAVDDAEAQLQAVNVDDTLVAFRASMDAGVARFVWLSSIKVLGETAAEPLTVAAPLDPASRYAESKARAEEALRDHVRAHPDLRGRLAIVRPPLVYGAGVRANFESLLRWAVSGRPLPLGHARAPRAWVSVGNLCNLLATLGLVDDLRADTWHVRDAEESSVRDMVLAIGAAAEMRPRLLSVPLGLLGGALRVAGRGGFADRLLAPLRVDMSQTEALLGWRPANDRADALAAAIGALSRR